MAHEVASNGASVRGRYAIVGIGETSYTRGKFTPTRELAANAVLKALDDAGLLPSDVDGMLSYQFSQGDCAASPVIAHDLGIETSFHLDVLGGGSSPEALIATAIGLIEASACRVVVVYRALNGYSGNRLGQAAGSSGVVRNEQLLSSLFGMRTPAQQFALTFARYMHEFDVTSKQIAASRAIQSEHAVSNPRALYRKRTSVLDVLESRPICSPIRLLDCCIESDGAAALIVTSMDRARSCRSKPVRILGAVGPCTKPRAAAYFQAGDLPITAGAKAAMHLWRIADVKPEDIDVTGAYDAFTHTVALLLEDFGFCEKGGGGFYVSDGTTRLGGRRPNNTSGGQLCEGYTHGLSLILENVRQLRGEADDTCPMSAHGTKLHTYDHYPGGCRQVSSAELAANLGWGNPAMASGLVLARY